MSGTRKMGKFELDAFVRDRLEEAVHVPQELDLPQEPEPEPAQAPAQEPEPEPAQAPAQEPEEPAEAPRSQAHAPARPPMSSGPTLKQVQDEPSVIVEHEKKTKKKEPADPAALRTRLAKKFVSLADDVNEEFNDFTIGAGAWGVELTAPQGMSTGGGKQALQHLRMRARRPGYSVLVGGTVNPVEKVAELRDYAHMCMMHEVRFNRRLEITESEWEQFLRKAEVVLREAEVRCDRVGPTKDLVAQRRRMTRVSRMAATALAVIVVLAAIVLFRIFST